MGASFSRSLFLSFLKGVLSPIPRRSEEDEMPDDATFGAPNSALRPESELASGLFGWPKEALSPTNCVKAKWGTEPYMQARAGSDAVDFTLATSDNTPFNLKKALALGRPVMVATGARSCPHCLAYSAEMEAVAAAYAGKVTFVCVAIMQPHPAAPSVCFETGEVWEMPAGISEGIAQPATVADRAKEAEWLAAKLPSWTCVADDLGDRPNCFWSTYGPAPRAAWLIDASGKIAHSQLWWEPTRTTRALDRHLARQT